MDFYHIISRCSHTLKLIEELGAQNHSIVFYKHMFTYVKIIHLYRFIFHGFPKVLINGDKLYIYLYLLGLVSFLVRLSYFLMNLIFTLPCLLRNYSLQKLCWHVLEIQKKVVFPVNLLIHSSNVVPHLPFSVKYTWKKI